jgi:phosphatidylethanolamine/phosphatidyl-N-methylethanolamine N-methyltransferase
MPSVPTRQVAASWTEHALFFRHWLRCPLGIGAVFPSGRAVARAMARELPAPHAGLVLELGGGTGALTQELLQAGRRAAELIVVEREPALSAVLRRRFPLLRVVEADAREVGTVLAELGVRSLAGVVSSLPIKWFDLADQRAVVDDSFAYMGADGVFLQLTNALVSPLPMDLLGIAGVEVARIWAQFPPVQIWRYRRAAAAGGAR